MSRGRISRIIMIVAALVTSVAAAGCGDGEESLGPPDEVAIEIGSQKITNGEIERRAMFIATTPTGADPIDPPATGSDEYREIRKAAAEQLRDERVFGILAAQCGKPCAVSAKEVDEQVDEILKDQFADNRANFEAALTQRGITLNDLKRSLRASEQEQRLSAREEAKVKYTEAEARAYYRKNIAQYRLPAERRLSHILVATKRDADAIRAEATPANFTQLARERSTDPAARSSGGDLGPVTGGGLVPEVSAAAAKLKPGQISAPVQSQFGWHILLIRDLKARTRAFEEVRSQIIGEQAQVKVAAAVQRWRDTVVKKQQDRAKYLNPRIRPPEPEAPATTGATTPTGANTGSTTGSGTTTGSTTTTGPATP